MGLERKSSSINVLWYLVELWDPWVLEDTPLLFVKFVTAGFISWEWWIRSAPPPAKKKKNGCFCGLFFRGRVPTYHGWSRRINPGFCHPSTWYEKGSSSIQNPECQESIKRNVRSLKCKSIHMDLTCMGETSNSTNHDRKELRWLWVWAFLLFCVCVFLQKVKEISMQNLVHPFAGIARNRTCPSNLDTLKTKTRCQANGMPWKIADSRHFLCKHAIVQVPKSKNATIMLLYSHHFLKISKNTLRPPSYLRISMTFAVLQMGFSVNLTAGSTTPLTGRWFFVVATTPQGPASRLGPNVPKKCCGFPEISMHRSRGPRSTRNYQGVGSFWGDRIWNQFFLKQYIISVFKMKYSL